MTGTDRSVSVNDGTKAELWLVRHGETEWSRSGQHTSRTELELTEVGERQAVAVAGLLEGENFDLALSSPRVRARRTAELAGLGDVGIDADLSEWDYGELEGLTTDSIHQRLPDWTIWDGPWPGGETAAEVAARADRVVARARALPPGARAIIVAHGHILRVVCARWLGFQVSGGRHFAIGTATLSRLGWEHGVPAVKCWNLPARESGAIR